MDLKQLSQPSLKTLVRVLQIYLVKPGALEEHLNLILKKTLNANDFSSDLCGNSDTGDKNVTMGGNCTSENTEGEDLNGGIAVSRGRGLLNLKLLCLFWTLKLKKLNINRKK